MLCLPSRQRGQLSCREDLEILNLGSILPCQNRTKLAVIDQINLGSTVGGVGQRQLLHGVVEMVCKKRRELQIDAPVNKDED